jgi:hypothetical protein
MLPSPEETLSQHLDSGERLLWSGRPRPGLQLRAQDAFLIPFSLLWCGFAIFWEMSVVQGEAPFFFWLWGIPFVLVGLYLVVGRFFVDAMNRARTVYGVTSERILIVDGILSPQIKSLQLRNLTDMTLTQRKDGSGTITFGQIPFRLDFFPTGSWPGGKRSMPPAFDFVENAKEVHGVVRSAQREAQR